MGIRAFLLPLCIAAGLASAGTPDIEWHDSLSAARTAAQAESRPILVYFWLDGSEYCKRMYAETLTTEAGAAALAKFECVSVPAGSAGARTLIDRFGVSTLPTLVFADSEGVAEDAVRGFMALDPFLAESTRILRGEKTVSDWRAQAAAAPEDLDVRLQLALQLEHVGQVDESARLQASILTDDPEGESDASAQLQLYEVLDSVRAAASDLSDPGTYPLEALYAYLPEIKPKAIQYEAWKWIADVERQKGDRSKERAALASVWRLAPPQRPRVVAGFKLLERYFVMDVELSDAERRLTLDVAQGIETEAGDDPNPTQRAHVHHAYAVAYAINGERAKALAALDRAVEASPDDPQHAPLREALKARAK